MKFKFLPVLLALMSTLAWAELPEETHGNLEKFIPELIQLVETKKYVEFFQAAMPPAYRAKIEKEGGVEKFAEKMTDKKAAKMVAKLKAIKDLKPAMSADGTVAVYKLPEGTEKIGDLPEFEKINGRWYIKN